MWKYLFKAKIFIPLIIVILAMVGVVISSRKNNSEGINLATAKTGTITQEVSVTGKLAPTENLDLAFERSGEVARVLAEVGDKVKTGQQLVVLKNADLAALVLQAQANLETEQAKLAELRKGTRPEELMAAETKVRNAQAALANAQDNLRNVESKAQADLDNVYNAALTAAQKAVTVAKSALLTLTDIQYAHFTGSDLDSDRIAQAKEIAMATLLGGTGGGRLNTTYVSQLEGGAFGTVKDAAANPTTQNVERAVAETVAALQKVSLALEAVTVTTQLTATEKTNLATEKSNVNTELTTVSGKQQSIAVQKVTNANNLNAAQTSLDNARSTLRSAEDDLRLKQAGSTPEQLVSQQARVKGTLANLQNAQATLGKTVISSPINGTVTKQDAKVGMIVTPNSPVISVISDTPLEVKADVPEVDIAKVRVDDPATMTLDAYGDDVRFAARVAFVEPAETVIQGVIYYKVTLVMEKLDDRSKPGMTANVNIITAQKDNVVLVPQRAVLQENGKTVVRVANPKDPKKYVKREVETGLSGSGGLVEIVSGLTAGEMVITYLET